VKCPNCDAEMHNDPEEDPDVWWCEECGVVEDRT
jgi:transposase